MTQKCTPGHLSKSKKQTNKTNVHRKPCKQMFYSSFSCNIQKLEQPSMDALLNNGIPSEIKRIELLIQQPR